MATMAPTLELPIDQAPPAAPAARAILDADPAALADWLAARGEKPLRARQLHRWLVAGRAESFDQMTDLPRDLRADLAADWTPFGTSVARHLTSSDGTQKLLLRLHDGRLIECVLIPE